MALLSLLASSSEAAPVPDPPVSRTVGRHASLQWTTATLSTQASGTWRVRIHVDRAATGIRIAYGNTYFHTAGPSAFTLEAVIESADGSQFWPVTWAGSAVRTFNPDDVATSDPIAGLSTTGPTDLFWRVHFTGSTVTHAGGGSPTTSTSGEGTTYYSGGAKNLTGAFTPGAVGFMRPVPRLIIGTTTPSPRALGLIGDSIMAAGGDAGSWAVRACIRDGVPYLLRAIGGSAMSNLTDAADFTRWFGQEELANVDHALLALGRNDSGDPRGSIANVLGKIRATGFTGQIVLATVSPSTNSTDGWATVGNQSSNGSDAGRLAFNAWVRDGAPFTAAGAVAVVGSGGTTVRLGDAGHPCTGVANPHPDFIDFADLVESARDSGRWKAGWTSDGLHPNEVGTVGIVSLTPAFAT